VTNPPRAHTGLAGGAWFDSIQAQFLPFTKPLDRQLSQFHAAGEENWNWNAIRSFLFLLPINPTRPRWPSQLHSQTLPAPFRQCLQL
jgi:hypothetical protein